MTRAWILMTAMPPTKGHRNLIKFGASLATEVHVIACTQDGEPFVSERVGALRTIAHSIRYSKVTIHQLHRSLPQDPETPGFWELWKRILTNGDKEMTPYFLYGVEPGDYIVSSEAYGKKLAELTGATFMTYDPNRELLPIKATPIREDVYTYFRNVAPEFQHNLRVNVTVFGAESTGKTTLSKDLAAIAQGHWFFEYARPYLKTVGPDIHVPSMTAIWKGQSALQAHSYDFYDKPVAVFDTDLYSTIGYWEQPHWAEALGPVPKGLISEANVYKSDLYIITKSNIPFEEDDIRYGGDRRESSDEYWIDVAERYGLNYVVLKSHDARQRLDEAFDALYAVQNKKWSTMAYDRGGF